MCKATISALWCSPNCKGTGRKLIVLAKLLLFYSFSRSQFKYPFNRMSLNRHRRNTWWLERNLTMHKTVNNGKHFIQFEGTIWWSMPNENVKHSVLPSAREWHRLRISLDTNTCASVISKHFYLNWRQSHQHVRIYKENCNCCYLPSELSSMFFPATWQSISQFCWNVPLFVLGTAYIWPTVLNMFSVNSTTLNEM